MKEELIKRMVRTKRLKLSFWRFCSYYWPVLLIFIPPIFTAYSLLKIYVFDTYDGVRSPEELISGTWIWIPIGLLVWFIQWYRLRFKIVNISITSEEFNEALKRTSNELNWEIENKKKFSVRAHRKGDFTGSWGEMITIFFRNEKLYLNSIPDPDNYYPGLTTFGWCKKDRDTFLKNLQEVRDNIPEKELTEEEGFMTKWTFWAVIVRIFIYPLALGILFLGAYIIYDGGNWIIGIAAMVVPATFLFTDIKIMFGGKRSIT
ncbi:MAG: hypothetical protein WDZ35_14635 [Crocinitomicaceae bacterium]